MWWFIVCSVFKLIFAALTGMFSVVVERIENEATLRMSRQEIAEHTAREEARWTAHHRALLSADCAVLDVGVDGNILVNEKGVEKTVHLMNVLGWEDIVL